MEPAGDDKVQELAYSNNPSKKIFRARKTMAASCRQQIASLSKIINISKIENSVNDLTNPPTEGAAQSQDTMSETNCITPKNPSEKTSVESGRSGESSEVSPNDLGLDAGCSYKAPCEETSNENASTSQNPVSVSPITSPALNNDNSSPVENDINVSTPATQNTDELSSMENYLNVATSAVQNPNNVTNINNSTLTAQNPDNLSPLENDIHVASSHTENQMQSDLCPISSGKKSNLLISEAASELSDKNVDQGSESTALRTIDQDRSSTVGLVTPMEYEDSSSAAVPSQEPNACSTIDTSDTVAEKVIMDSVANSTSSELSQDGDSTSDNLKRKRTSSGDEEVSKRAKTSKEGLLDEIRNIIERRIQTVFKESFDQRMQDLSQQISLIQSKGHDADSIAVHVKRIRRLGKRIKYALDVQTEMARASNKLQSASAASDEPSQTQPGSLSSTNVSTAEPTVPNTENKSVQKMSSDNLDLVVLSDNETEQTSNAEKGKTGDPNPPKKVDSEAIRKILESIKEHRKKTLSSKVSENGKTIIDLTDDEEVKSDKDSKRDEAVPSPPISTPVQDNRNSPQNSVEAKEPHSVSTKEEPSADLNERTSVVPKSTQTLKAHDSGTTIQISNPDPGMLKPPQKPELRLAQVQNPKGIALSWNITQVDPSCAPAKVYCLYVNQENPNSPKKLWKKIGEIKALPLPMACTLTQFVDDATYSFALRAKDAFGRFGPLCDIQSTTLKSLTTLKRI